MTKIEEFVKLITGRFDNKEQFDAMKKVNGASESGEQPVGDRKIDRKRRSAG